MLSRARRVIALSVMALGLFVLGIAQADAQASGGYIIKPGDKLRVEVFEDASLNRDVLVLPDGSFSFPLVGSVTAKGRTIGQVGAAVRSRLAPNFATPPSVHVAIAALAPKTSGVSRRTVDVYALGEVGDPGRKEVSRGITLLQFLAEAGGLGPFAAEKRIELLRTDPKSSVVTTYVFNYRAPQGSTTSINGGTTLQDGDVIKVPQKRLFE